ncbi:unnamed protein product [Phytomonas sp. Hart1]|nr:unnamed protein product [Phytomonas sp. Hart1]|eukprot:CCW70015.1 unnamed protein product [Phytomonas sp. isolate Hart1]
MCVHPPNKRHWRLYYLLELDESVTSKQVKWNFRRVSLRNHYQQAYLVLYSRTRKHLYDALGEEVYGFIASGAWGPLISILGATSSIIIYCLTMLIQVGLLGLFFVFLAAKIENVMTLEWDDVILPLIIFGMIMCFFTFLSILVNLTSTKSYKEGLNFVDRLSPIGNCLAAVCYSCVPFVITSALTKNDDKGVGHYMVYLSILILGDIFYYLTSLIWRWPNRIRLQMQIDDKRKRSLICYGIFLMAFLHLSCGIAQWVLLARKIDQRFKHSWYIVFIPFCVRAGLCVIEVVLRSSMFYTMRVRNKAGVAFDVLVSFFSNGNLLISLYLVAAFLERGGLGYSFFYLLIPVYARLGYVFVCLILTMILLLRRVSCSTAREKRTNRLWIPENEKNLSLLGSKSTQAVPGSEPGPCSNWGPDEANSRGSFGPLLIDAGPSLERSPYGASREGLARTARSRTSHSRTSHSRTSHSRVLHLRNPHSRSPNSRIQHSRSPYSQNPQFRRSAVHRDPYQVATSSTDEYESYSTNKRGLDLCTEGSYEYVSDYEYLEGSQPNSASSSVVSSPILKPQHAK